MSGPVFQLAFGEPPKPQPGQPEPEVAASKLCACLAAYQVLHDLKVGDLVQYKPLFMPADWEMKGQPLLLVATDLTAYPQPINSRDGTARRLDVVVWALVPSGGVIALFADRHLLEPWVPPAQAGPAAPAPSAHATAPRETPHTLGSQPS